MCLREADRINGGGCVAFPCLQELRAPYFTNFQTQLAWSLQGFASVRFTESVKSLLREREKQVLMTLLIVSINQTAWEKKKFFLRHTYLIYP